MKKGLIHIFLICLLFSKGYESVGQFINKNQPFFENLTKEQGLLHAHIISIRQDKQGYIWLSSFGGLHRYDGSEFDYYIHQDSIEGSIANNSVYSTFQDSKNRLWAGSENGLSLFIPETNNWKNYSDSSFGFKNFGLREIAEDQEGYLWIATYGAGLAKFDPDKGKIIQWFTKENNQLEGNFINVVFVDRQGNIWAGLESQGLFVWDKTTKRFIQKAIDIADRTINSIKEDKNGKLWIGTWVGGLSCYDPVSGKTKNYHSNPKDPTSIPDHTIRQLDIDQNGAIWLATTNGLGYFDPVTEICTSFRNNKSSSNSLAFDFLWSILVDKEGIVWVGSFGNGLSKLDPHKNKFNIVNTSTPGCSVEYNYVDFIARDSKNNLWVAANSGGIYAYKPGKDCIFENKLGSFFKEKKIRCFYEDRNHQYWLGCEDGVMHCTQDMKQLNYLSLRNGLDGFSIFTIHEDKEGNVWFGGWNTGLLMLPVHKKNDPGIQQKDLISYSSLLQGTRYIPTNVIWNISLGSDGQLWVATDHELLKMNEHKSFEIYEKNVINISGFAEYPKGTIWISNAGTGLLKIQNGKKSKNYSFPGPQSSIAVYGILVKDKTLWLGTENGLYSFDPSTEIFQHYTTLDGLPSNTFVRNSAAIAADGSLLMGTPNGMIRFFPDELSRKNQDPPIRISDIGLFHKSISLEHSADPLLKNSLENTREVTLDYDQNVLSISFSAIQHSIPQKLKFTYLLEGFNKEWLETENGIRKVTFTNLDPGEYMFRVRTISENGKQGQHEASIKLVILPPFWKTWWFQALLVTFVGLIVLVIFNLRTKQIQKRNSWLQHQVNERTRELKETNTVLADQNEEMTRQSEKILEQQKELLDKKYILEKTNNELADWNEFQNRLIGILSHDIRGPLQNFSLLLKLQSEESKEWVQERLKETADSLSLLASDLLGWVNLLSKKGTLSLSEFTWKEVIEKAVKEIEPARAEKGITFSIKCTDTTVVSGLPPIALSSLRNILMNAIKFSHKNSMIEIEEQHSKDGYSALRITDFGPGFNPAEINELIRGEAFKGMKENNLKDGAGLGMAICYDMLKRINGRIEAASIPGSGGTFYLYLPLASSSGPLLKTTPEDHPSSLTNEKTELLRGKKMLLVDDDDELRWIVAKSLSKFMEIHEVRSAEEAMDWLEDNTPDIALLDVFMPGISGIELCKKIKSSPGTAHVPCMVISGDTEELTRAAVFNAGADSFLTKPFKPEELLVHIITYFENYAKNIRRFFTTDSSVDQLTQNPINKEFLSRLVFLIENHLSSDELNVDFLARELGLSRSSLYRRLKSLTGQTVNDFIKNIRMRKSFSLLKEGNLNISEVAIETGFASPSYFASSFKKHFGYSPTELRN